MYCSHSVVFFPLFFIISKQKRLAKKTSEEAAKVEQTLKWAEKCRCHSTTTKKRWRWCWFIESKSWLGSGRCLAPTLSVFPPVFFMIQKRLEEKQKEEEATEVEMKWGEQWPCHNARTKRLKRWRWSSLMLMQEFIEAKVGKNLADVLLPLLCHLPTLLYRKKRRRTGKKSKGGGSRSEQWVSQCN